MGDFYGAGLLGAGDIARGVPGVPSLPRPAVARRLTSSSYDDTATSIMTTILAMH